MPGSAGKGTRAKEDGAPGRKRSEPRGGAGPGNVSWRSSGSFLRLSGRTDPPGRYEKGPPGVSREWFLLLRRRLKGTHDDPRIRARRQRDGAVRLPVMVSFQLLALLLLVAP